MQTPMLVRPPPSSKDLPYSDGEPMESERHFSQMMLLINSLKYEWRNRRDYYVAGNMFLYFSETQSKKNDFRGPDLFVVLGTEYRERKSWVVWEEDGKAPDVVIELLSESTEHVDRNDKMRIYGRNMKVGEYFLFDPFTTVLEGYSLDVARGSYVRKPEDSHGRIQCEQLGLWLGVRTSVIHHLEIPRLRWLRDDGTILPYDEEIGFGETERANAEAERANAEAERANAEAERADRLAAELATLRAKLGQ